MSGFDVLTRGDVLDSALQARDYLVSCGVPGALAAKDPELWGRRAVDHSRLGWLDLPFASRGLLNQVEGLVAEARYSGLDHIVLIGVGAESLAAQAIMEAHASGGAAGRPDRPAGELTVLDGSDTAALAFALERLDRTLVVLASKAGVSLEGDAYRRIFANAFRDLGLSQREIAGRFLVITDHGSPLHDFARQNGYRIGLTDPYLPGHFGALSAYGLVPAVLAGADANALLEDAASLVPSLSKEEDNPGLLLGAVLGGCAQQGPGGIARDKVVLREPGGPGALSAWVSQLLAVGTGRRGRGVVAFEPSGCRGSFPDVHGIALNPPSAAHDDSDTAVLAPVGAQFLLWEYATAVAGWLLGVNPFETGATAVQEAEDDAATLLRAAAGGPLTAERPAYTEDDIEVYVDFPWPAHADLRTVLGGLVGSVPADGYLAVMTYLSGDFSGRYLAPSLARASGRPVAYGPGPAYPHATAPVHKEGPGNGAFLIITGDPVPGDALAAHPVPGRPYSLAQLRLARALGELRTLRARRLPVIRLHLRNPVEGAGRLTEAVREVASMVSAGRGQ
ncbi:MULTISPECIES: phosphoheptose isomerase [Actinomadura]|uniref:phosphoheptose isomerase n=1 Tax=Actinomadura TaxID=1988 RepID=UPI0003FB6436|nr:MULTISPECIES: phosphoheptose isomerase [Actinomadura]RSN70818.1 phosphoheptose isomerase [Actinomadura sp. WAC 06369]